MDLQLWVKMIRDSKLGKALLFVAKSIATVCISFFIAAVSSSLKIENVDSRLIGELVFGICMLIGGIGFFGFTLMRANLTKASFRRIWIIIIFLVATIWVNITASPIGFLAINPGTVVGVLVTGFWEEVVFRGFLFALWEKLFGLRSSISIILLLLISSLIFGLFHSNYSDELFLRSSLGVLLGIVTLFTHTIVFSILLHAIYNGLPAMIEYGISSPASPALRMVGLVALCAIGLWIVLQYSRHDAYLAQT